jgi:multiple sugar transport system permease protein
MGVSQWTVARQAVAAAAAGLFLLPLVLLVAGSLREVGPGAAARELIPSRPTLDNYRVAPQVADLGRQALNSTLVAAAAVPLSVAVAAAGGFALARLPTRPRRVLLAASLVAGMVPLSMLLVGRFALFRGLGVTDTWLPLVATGLIGGSPFNVLLLYLTFRRLPGELWDAATLDGASTVRLLVSIGLPAARSALVAVALLAFALSWGNMLEPLVYLSDEALYTLPLGLRALASLDVARQPIMLAGAVLATLIPVVLLVVAQRALRDDPPNPL